MKRPFVDRIEELRYLNNALKYDGKETPLRVFTGIGGMGKTALRIAFEEEILKANRIPYAVLDYDGDPNLRSIEATLRAIRRQLGRHRIKTPVFDFLYARYFELSTGLKLSKKNFPLELEGVVNILEAIPGVSNVTQVLHGLSQLGLVTKERLQHKEWLYRIRDLEPRDLLNLLPEVLAEDLEDAMISQPLKTLKNSGCRIALLLDAYERVSDSRIDDTLHRKLLLLTPHLFRVIFTRTPLPWEHTFAHEWHGGITHFPALDDLSQEDAIILLQKKHIDNSDIQAHLYELTSGYPLHLELCADICREIREMTEREPEIDDFEGAAQARDLTEELVKRLLRQLTDNERDLMELAAYPRWVSQQILEVLSSIPESVPRIFKKFVNLSMFSPHAEIPDAYVIRKEVRAFLMQRQRKERLFTQRHRKLSQFYKECWERTQSFLHLREALYHKFYDNTDEAMMIFEEHFWQMLKRLNFAEAEGLLEAIPIETLGEKQKRRVDYVRARLLTSVSHSRQSLTNAKKLYETIVTSETNEEYLTDYLFRFAHLLRELGEYESALENFKKNLAISLKVFGDEHPKVAASYCGIGNVYDCMSSYGKALECHQKALVIRLKLYTGEHRDIAASYNNIGILQLHKGEYGKALEYSEKALAIWLKIYGEEHPHVAKSYVNIGIIYQHKGEYEKAFEYNQKAIAIWLKVYGDEHVDIAKAYGNMGVSCYYLREYDRALEYHQKNLAIYLRVYGAEHPDTAKPYNNIGLVYQQKGEYEKALEYHQKALAIRLKALSAEHPHVATSYDSIASVYDELGEHGKAMEYNQNALAIRRKAYGDEHPDVAKSYLNAGIVCDHIGESARALEYHEKALAIRRKVFGEKHPDVAESYSYIAHVVRGLKRQDESIENLQRSINICREFRLWKNVLESLETYVGWLEKEGRKTEANRARAEAQKIREDHGLP